MSFQRFNRLEHWIEKGKFQSMGMDAVIRVKDERLHVVKGAIALFNTRKVDKEWTINQGGNKKCCDFKFHKLPHQFIKK